MPTLKEIREAEERAKKGAKITAGAKPITPFRPQGDMGPGKFGPQAFKNNMGTPFASANTNYTKRIPALQGGANPIDTRFEEGLKRYMDMARQSQTGQDMEKGVKSMLGGFADAGKELGANIPRAMQMAPAIGAAGQAVRAGNITFGQSAEEMRKMPARPESDAPYSVIPGNPPPGRKNEPPVTARPGEPQTAQQAASPQYQQPQQTGNRYLDIARAGSDDLQKYIQGMPEDQRPIDLIRGTDRSFYDPRSQQEYATMAEAAFGVNRADAMQQYGIEAPIDAQMKMAQMKGEGASEPKYKSFTFERPVGQGQGIGIFDEKSGQPRFYDAEGKRIDFDSDDEYANAMLPAILAMGEDEEAIGRVAASMPAKARARLAQLIEDLGKNQ